MRSFALGLAILAGGCLKADLVECNDGRTCPNGTVCDEERHSCLDPMGLSVPEGTLDFASVGCGSHSELTLPLRNYGVTEIPFEAASTMTGVSVAPASGAVPAGGSVELVLTAMPATQTIPGVPMEGTLQIATPRELVERQVRMTTLGGLADVASTLDFGEAGVAQTITRYLTIMNNGNAGFDVSTSTAAPAFVVTTTGPVHVDPGTSRDVQVRFTPPSLARWLGSASLVFTGELCQAPKTSVELSGVGTGDKVLSDHTAIDFPPVACGAAMTTSSIHLTNNSPMPQTVTFSVTGADAAWFQAPPSVVIPISSGVDVIVSRAAIAGGSSTAGLTASLVLTSSPANETKMIALAQPIVAPVLSTDISTVDLTVGKNGSMSKTVQLTNSGNAVASVSVTPPMLEMNGTKLSVSPNPFQIAPSQVVNVSVVLTAGSVPGTLPSVRFNFNATGQCSAVPAVNVTATVTNTTGTVATVMDQELP